MSRVDVIWSEPAESADSIFHWLSAKSICIALHILPVENPTFRAERLDTGIYFTTPYNVTELGRVYLDQACH